MEGADPGENSVDVRQEPGEAAPEQKAEIPESEKADISKDALGELERENKKLRGKYKKAKKEIEELKTKRDSLVTELGEVAQRSAVQADAIKRLEERLQQAGSSSGTSSVTELKEKAKQADGLEVQANYLTRRVLQTQESETYLRERLADALQSQEESELKMKDLQVRLKRFIKDDQVKDGRIVKMEQELKDITQQVEELEKYVDAEQVQRIRKEAGSTSSSQGSTITSDGSKLGDSVNKSKSCTIL